MQSDPYSMPRTHYAKSLYAPPPGRETFYASDALFDLFTEYDEKNFVMAASIEGDAGEKKRPDGLVEGHEYSLLQVRSRDARMRACACLQASRDLTRSRSCRCARWRSATAQRREWCRSATLGATRLSGTRTGPMARRCGKRTRRWLLAELVTDHVT